MSLSDLLPSSHLSWTFACLKAKWLEKRIFMIFSPDGACIQMWASRLLLVCYIWKMLDAFKILFLYVILFGLWKSFKGGMSIMQMKEQKHRAIKRCRALTTGLWKWVTSQDQPCSLGHGGGPGHCSMRETRQHGVAWEGMLDWKPAQERWRRGIIWCRLAGCQGFSKMWIVATSENSQLLGAGPHPSGPLTREGALSITQIIWVASKATPVIYVFITRVIPFPSSCPFRPGEFFVRGWKLGTDYGGHQARKGTRTWPRCQSV